MEGGHCSEDSIKKLESRFVQTLIDIQFRKR